MRQGLRANGPEWLKARLVNRARPIRFFAHPGELKRLSDNPELAMSGISAASAYGLDLVAGAELDAYIRAGDLKGIQKRHALEPSRASKAMFSCASFPPPPGTSRGDCPLAAVALDFSDEADSRSSRVGGKAIGRIRSGASRAA